jgi:hypothetical protein
LQLRWRAALQSLNERLPQDETVSAIVYCMDPVKGYGYLALTDRRLVLTLGKDGRSPSALAVPLAEVSRFVFDAGVAACSYGVGETFTIAFPHGGSYSLAVCEEIRRASDEAGPYSI